MKSYKYKVLTLGFALAGLASCSDSFLDKVPDERTEIDTEDKVVSLLVSAYPESCPAWVGELSSDNLIDNQAPHLPSSPNDKQIKSHYNYGSYAKWDDELFSFEPASNATYSAQDSPGALWGSYYNSVATVNQALAGIDRVSPNGELSAKMKAAKGEALLLRAYDHFQLVNIFSKAYKNEVESKKDVGVPYVTEIEDVVTKKYDRINVDSVYKLIGKDLEEGLSLISDVNYTTAPKYHFNTNAAHAFAARYYLFKRDYNKVIEHANAVLGTDSVSAQRMVMNLATFADCATISDYANAWVSPSLNNNLLILDTYSVLSRRVFGYRYSCAGPSASNVLMVRTNSPLWSGYIASPIAIVNGSLFGSSSHDYGFFCSKIQEHFQYTDKVTGIGYVHQMYRAFTANELLLERAEAETMLGKYADASNDLRWYWNCSINSMDADNFKLYFTGGKIKYLTDAMLDKYYVGTENKSPNNFENWDFTQKMSADFIVPEQAIKYMNCINDFRRFETAFEGLRFFDLKRWGIDYEHVIGVDENHVATTYNDTKRVIEIPWESLSAGMESSRTEMTNNSQTSKLSMNPSSFVVKTK